MRSIATISLSGDLREKLEAVSAAGFEGVEIFENDLLSFDGSAGDVRALLDDLGLRLVAFQPFRDFEGMPEPQRGRALDRAERKFDLMQTLGTDLLLVCSNTSPNSAPGIDRAAEDLARLADRARTRGLRIGFEALAWGQNIADYRDAWEAVKRADHPALGTVLDSFHILARGDDPAAIADIPGERIFLVQLADAPLLEMNVKEWSRHHRCFPGQGRLPLDSFMTPLHRTGYTGPLSLEIFNDAFRTSSPRATALDGLRSLIYLDESIPSPVPTGPTVSPPSAYHGIAFVEFTLDEPEAERFGDVAGALGFHRAGRHKSKDVDHWQQGDINLIVNREPNTFAQSFRLLHGPSVCAVGFRVDDPRNALERATAYKCQRYEEPVGPDEMHIPALRGIEGSLIYLVDTEAARDQVWQTDFKTADKAGGAEAGLRSVDHVSYILPTGQLLRWELFYKTVFGFIAGPEHEIADPRGVVMSKALISRDGTIAIPLNVSQGRNTMAGRFLSYSGAGVQQIAFSSSDIMATADRMIANGVPILPIPENYYEDLGTRFDLSDQRIEALRRRNILYDCNEDGEFLQFYTDTFEERFFFEVVERRGYQQFGAANAPIRLAAQARQTAARHFPD